MATLSFKFGDKLLFAKTTYVGESKPWGDKYVKKHHYVILKCDDDDVQVEFDYYCNEQYLKPKDVANAVWCLAMDATSYANATDIDDFASEFGYDKVSRAIEVYNACKKSYDDLCKFGFDVFDFCNWLQEKYDF